ncbi:MAG: ATP phosphoribosyltransferase regulatory subunit [Caldilineaceae bacterium]|nr:ATP phosphoribosyltransferase regulatory subunit [Caldilineaceae bacterium]
MEKRSMIDASGNAFGAENHAQLPNGVADYFWDEALQRRRLENDLLETFRCWGYADVVPPMFEYAETLNARAGKKLRSEMYRLQDRDGSTLALRADLTIPVARLVGTRLHDWPMPQRFCYAGSVFRHVEPQAGRQCEFWQAGVELIGAHHLTADAEVLAVTAHAVQVAGIANFQLVVGQIQYFSGLLTDLQLSPAHHDLLLRAIDRNSAAELADFLREVSLSPEQRRTVEGLPELSGADPDEIFVQAGRLCLNPPMHNALANLRAVYEALDAYGLADYLFVDLTEIHDLGYYSGMTFEVLTPELGFALGSGGRYDDLIGTFGKQIPAVGVALGIDRILLARQLQFDRQSIVTPTAAQLLVSSGGNAHCLKQVMAWRNHGVRIAVDVSANSPQALCELAARSGVGCALVWSGNGYHVYEEPGNPNAAAVFSRPQSAIS